MYCSKCGAMQDDAAAFCQNCGAPTGVASPQAGPPPAMGTPAVGVAPAAAPYAGTASTAPQYAGFWLRFIAYVIDGLIVGVAALPAIVLVLVMTGAGSAISSGTDETPQDIFAAVGILFVLVFIVAFFAGTWLYYASMESSSWQGTLGKKALGLVVTDLEGRRVTFARGTGRFFAKFITGLIPFAIGYIIAGFTAKKQAIHDMIAGCLVLRKL